MVNSRNSLPSARTTNSLWNGATDFLDYWTQLNVPTSTAPDHGVVVIGWGECPVTEPVPDDDVNPCDVEGMSPMVVGESWIMQNSWGATRGYNLFDFRVR